MTNKTTTTLLCALPLLTATVTLAAPPNIIHILADDLGLGDLGCYGQQKIETPNLDALAARGIRLTQYYAGSPVSAPSRCTMLTGLHSGHAYIRGNDEMSERGNVRSHVAMSADPRLEGQRPLPADTITFPLLLQKAGYATACVGKWGLGHPGSVSTPNKMGFDFFYGYNCQRMAHTYYPPYLYRNETREPLRNKPFAPEVERLDKNADPRDEKNYAKFNQQDYSEDLMFNEILKFIETATRGTTARQRPIENRESKIENPKPFFLFWTTIIPHVSLQAPERWVQYYKKKFGDEDPYLSDPRSGYFPCRYPRATYAAMVSYLDENVGRLVAKLKELGVYENTIIILTSDNGPAASAGGSDSAWFDSARPLRSASGWIKGNLREGGIRVPLIAAWPGKIKPGTQSNHICAGWDTMATICELANVKTPPNDGISFVPALLGKKQKQHDYLYWEFPESGGQKAVRMGKWKGLILDMRKNPNSPMLLYDLETDPLEQNNLAAQHPELIKTLRQKMTDSHTPSQIPRFQF